MGERRGWWIRSSGGQRLRSRLEVGSGHFVLVLGCHFDLM